MSLYGAYAHSDVFGIIGALSPSIWWSDQELLSYAAGQPKPPSTVYMDMGTLEGGIDDLRAMRDVMVGQGFVLDDDLMVVEAEGGEHNEWHWAQRFPGTLQFLFPPPETSVAPPGDVPAATLLRPNAPNPFALHTTLRLSLPARANVRLTVHDVAGRCVRELFAEQLPAGPHESIWDGRDDRGVRAASGIYFYRVQVGESVEQRKMVLLR